MTTAAEILRPSQLYRARLCPCSPFREFGLESDSPAATEGRYLHELIAAKIDGGLDADGLQIHEEHAGLIRRCYDALPYSGPWHVEQKVAITRADGSPLLPNGGTIDAWSNRYATPQWADIIDWKFGRAEAIEVDDISWQGMAYAVGLHSRYGFNLVTFREFHPRLSVQPDPVTFGGNQTEWRELEDCIAAVVAACSPDAPAQPSKIACTYCKAAPTCAEFQEWAGAGVRAIVAAKPNEVAMPVETAVALLDNYKDQLAMAAKILDAAEEVLKAALIEGREVPGWGLKPGNKQTKLTSAKEAFNLMLEADVPAHLLLRCCSIELGKLEDAYKETHGGTGNQARFAVREILASVIETRQNKPSLVRVKKQE